MAFLFRTNQTIPLGAVPISKATPAEGLSVQVTSVIFLAFAWLVVILRFWTRILVVRAIGWDDWTMGISAIFFTVFCTGCIVCATATTGTGFIQVSEVDKAINWLLVAEIFYVLTMLMLKISIAIFFLRIMVKPWQRRTVYLAVGLATVFGIGYLFFAIFQCGYPSSAMLFLVRKLSEKCVNKEQILGVSYTHGAITSMTDVVFAVLPVAMLWGSNINSREKTTVALILVLAAVGGIASLVRMNFIGRLATATRSFFTDVNIIAIWSTIEPGLGIIAGSLATLRPLFRTCLSTARSYGGSRRGRNSRSDNKSVGTLVELAPRKDSLAIPDAVFYQGSAPNKGNMAHPKIRKQPWRPARPAPKDIPDFHHRPNSEVVFNRRVDIGDIEHQPQPRRLDSAECLVDETYHKFPQPPTMHGHAI